MRAKAGPAAIRAVGEVRAPPKQVRQVCPAPGPRLRPWSLPHPHSVSCSTDISDFRPLLVL